MPMSTTVREYPSKAAILLAIIAIPLGGLYAQRSRKPVPLRPDITIRPLVDVGGDCVRIATDSARRFLYYMTLGGDIHRVDPVSAEKVRLYTADDHGVLTPQGFTISQDGSFFVVGDIYQNDSLTGIIRRGSMVGKNRVWTTVATAEPYPLNTHYNHAFNAVEVSPDGKYIYVNSGSRTDHCEMEHREGPLAGLREIPLTSKIFRLPADGLDLTLRNNLDSLTAAGYVYAYGLRNTFDLATGPDGNLFGTENSDDRDDEEELNWIREGGHYGFPWRIGTHDTPQRIPGYRPESDLLLNHDSYAYSLGFYYDDSTYPAPPPGVAFTDPVTSTGPDADRLRDPVTGMILDASETETSLGTFTPHRSPLGLVFDNEHLLASDMAGDGFMLSWSDSADALLAPMLDGGSDMMQIHLEKNAQGDNYTARVTRLINGFRHPVDAVMIGSRIYVLENADSAFIWEVTLPGKSGSVESAFSSAVSLSQPMPNPSSSSVTLSYWIPAPESVRLVLYDRLGREVVVLRSDVEEGGDHTVRISTEAMASGIYYCRLYADRSVLTRAITVAR
jgi:hypothetical protein